MVMVLYFVNLSMYFTCDRINNTQISLVLSCCNYFTNHLINKTVTTMRVYSNIKSVSDCGKFFFLFTAFQHHQNAKTIFQTPCINYEYTAFCLQYQVVYTNGNITCFIFCQLSIINCGTKVENRLFTDNIMITMHMYFYSEISYFNKPCP